MSLCHKPMATHGGGLLTLTQPLACPCTPAPQQAQAQPLVSRLLIVPCFPSPQTLPKWQIHASVPTKISLGAA